MARYSVSYKNVVPAAVADTTAFASANFATILGSNASGQQLKINEVYIGGEATSSSVNSMLLARDSTNATTPAAGSTFNALMDATATAPATLANTGNSAATYSQRSSTGHLLALSLNTYGGIARWQARYGEEITCFGNTQPNSEVSLSSVAGTGQISGHIIYEVV